MLTENTAKIDDLAEPTVKLDDTAEPTVKIGDGTPPTAYPIWNLPPVELAEPPVYSADRTMRASKDGMVWVPVAPHAAAAPAIPIYSGHATTAGFANVAQGAVFGGAAQTSGPFTTVTVGGPPPPEPPNDVKKAFDVFTRTNLSPQEQRMKEELESLLKRHQEVLDANAARSKS